MQRKLHVVTFSPTGTSKAIAWSMVEGMGAETVQEYDITRPEERRQNNLSPKEGDLILFAAPTYAGRLPFLVHEWLKKMNPAPGTPAVCIVTYGNRDYDDALLELCDIVTERGYKPIAAAAFIGEHSFSSKALPIASGRPHSDDLDLGLRFGRDVLAYIENEKGQDAVGTFKVSGNVPYKEVTLAKGDFIAVSDACVRCGVCADACPAEAIDVTDGFASMADPCIVCCACIKSCPQEARSLKQSRIMDAAKRLHENCSTPKHPAFFWLR